MLKWFSWLLSPVIWCWCWCWRCWGWRWLFILLPLLLLWWCSWCCWCCCCCCCWWWWWSSPFMLCKFISPLLLQSWICMPMLSLPLPRLLKYGCKRFIFMWFMSWVIKVLPFMSIFSPKIFDCIRSLLSGIDGMPVENMSGSQALPMPLSESKEAILERRRLSSLPPRILAYKSSSEKSLDFCWSVQNNSYYYLRCIYGVCMYVLDIACVL